MNSGTDKAKTEELNDIDILEDSILHLDKSLMQELLFDRTTRKNIVWATSDYEFLGEEYLASAEITLQAITGANNRIIQPRVSKARESQNVRTRSKAEVFTPSWICNTQNNLIDTQWFGRDCVFNVECEASWKTKHEPIDFIGSKGNWMQYVDSKRLEVSCGEAPYLVSRYDSVTGERIPLKDRIGILDRKLRIVSENARHDEEWLKWSWRAVESVYGFEYQGDNLLLARENILCSYIDYYYDRFKCMPELRWLRKIARTISWNVWQMDGIKGVIPASCRPLEQNQVTLFDDGAESTTCPGCAKGDIFRHTGIYCKVKDWRGKKTQTYVSLLKGGK